MPTKRTRIYIHVTSELSEPHPLDAEIMKLAGQLRRFIRERASYFNSIAHRDQVISPKHRAAITEKLAGRTYSAETLAKFSASHTGKSYSQTHRDAISRGLQRMHAKRREAA